MRPIVAVRIEPAKDVLQFKTSMSTEKRHSYGRRCGAISCSNSRRVCRAACSVRKPARAHSSGAAFEAAGPPGAGDTAALGEALRRPALRFAPRSPQVSSIPEQDRKGKKRSPGTSVRGLLQALLLAPGRKLTFTGTSYAAAESTYCVQPIQAGAKVE